MRFFLVTLTMALAAVVWMWADRPGGAGQHPAWMPRDPALQARLLERARVLGARLPRELGATDTTLFRLLVLADAGPIVALAFASAVLAGLALRESARTALRFSSPTWNYLGKRLTALGLVGLLTLPLVPAGVPPWSCYLALLAMCLGVFLYVGNLPVKL